MPTAQEIYTSAICDLPPDEQLRLAALILDGLAQTDLFLPEGSNRWNEEDQQELTDYPLRYAETQFVEDEELH